MSSLTQSYKGGGTSGYHLRMLLKVIIYAYLLNLYTSRKIEQALCVEIGLIAIAHNLNKFSLAI
ncbi:transposase [Polaribacter sp. M15]